MSEREVWGDGPERWSGELQDGLYGEPISVVCSAGRAIQPASAPYSETFIIAQRRRCSPWKMSMSVLSQGV